MKFLIDESVEYRVVEFLKSLGHDVVDALKTVLSRYGDELPKSFVVVTKEKIRIRKGTSLRV